MFIFVVKESNFLTYIAVRGKVALPASAQTALKASVSIFLAIEKDEETTSI
jgi:hypothetical protein